MGRKKKLAPDVVPSPDAVPPPALSREVVVERGKWDYFKDGVGFMKSQFRATFSDDPRGCVGHGWTQAEAIELLRFYERLGKL